MSKRRIQQAQYAFKGGSRFGINADVAGTELARIHQESGVLTPPAVVDAARPEDSPLHPAFEWRDEEAAEKYRRWQARMLIKAVYVVKQDGDRKTQAPVYVHVPDPVASDESMSAGNGYQPVSVVVARPDMYASALGDLTRRMMAAQEAVESLQQAAEKSPDTDQERMARIAIAVQAMQTASAAVQALH